MSGAPNNALLGWYSSDFKAERVDNNLAKADRIPGYDGAYRIELIGVKKFIEGTFEPTAKNQYSLHEFVGDVGVEFVRKTLPNPAALTFRSLIIRSPVFSGLGYHDNAVFGHIEGYGEASVDSALSVRNHQFIEQTTINFRDKSSCFSHSSGCWSQSFPYNNSACFNPYGGGCFGISGCFNAPFLPGCGVLPGCFSLPFVRFGWNLLALLGAIALILSLLCNLMQWYEHRGEGQQQQRHQGQEFTPEPESQIKVDERGYVRKESGGKSLKGKLLFSIADHKDIDGDVVDVFIDDKPLILGLELTDVPYKLTSDDLEEGKLSTLKVYPVSVGRGTEKVCTARMILYEECTGIQAPPFRMVLKSGEVGEYTMYVQSNSCD